MEEKRNAADQNKFVKIFSDLVGLFDNKPRAAATVAMILVIIYLWNRNDQLNSARIQDQKEFNAAIVAEVRKQVKQPLEDIKNTQQAAIDSNKRKIDSTRAEISPILETIKETVKNINRKK